MLPGQGPQALVAPVALVLAVAVVMATVVVATVIVATAVATVVMALIGVGLVAQVVTQRTTSTAAGSRADVATGSTAYRATHHVTACRAQGTANSGFTALALVGTQRTAGRTAQAGTNGAAGATADGVTDNGAQYPTLCAANAGLGGAACHGNAAEQAERQQQNRGVLLHQESLIRMTRRI